MNIGLFDDAGYLRLLPLTWTRAACELRVGIDRLLDKVAAQLGPVSHVWTRPVLQELVNERLTLAPADPRAPWLLVNGRAWLTGRITPPPVGHAWRDGDDLIAATVAPEQLADFGADAFGDPGRPEVALRGLRTQPAPAEIRLVEYPWDLALGNGVELRRQCTGGGALNGRVHDGAHLVNRGSIHIAAGAVVKPGAVLDAEDGPIFLDEHATISPNAVVEGPCYIGPRTIIRPGAVIRPDCSIGPVCKIGGELEASIVHGYSNKQHDGFLGHSYVGQWVNLGAGTITSDLKNTYGTIRVSLNGRTMESGQRFIGAIIGDHAKTGIGTILPTGCVIGVAANVFTRNVVPKFVPSFAWLTESGLTNYRVDKAIEIMRIVMSRRRLELGDAERRLIEHAAQEARRIEAAGWQ